MGPLLCLVFLDTDETTVMLMLLVAALVLVPTFVGYVFLRRGVAGIMMKVARRLPVLRKKDLSSWTEKAAEVDRRIRQIRHDQPVRFWRAIVWFACARFCQTAEVWILLLALFPGEPLAWTFLLAVLMQTLRHLIAWVIAFVPGQVGVAEGGATLLFSRLGLTPQLGLAVELVRRAGLLVGISIGLLLGWVVVPAASQRASTAGG
ncbi:MAG: hypothetical protein D6806_10395 [Deltaproteobacteria bacterium]|nr:MAG: hypothetical protein D6806_10395 [Deltaproteobacteria bacterium]